MKGNSKIEKCCVENIFYSIFFLSNSSLKWKEDLHSSGLPWLDQNMTQLKVSSLSWKTSLDVIVFML